MASTLIRRARLFSGVLLFAFVLTHLWNHALGLVSLRALEGGREIFLLLWRSPPFEQLLMLAVILHPLLAIWALYERRRLSMPLWQVAQLLLGLAIPPLLVLHILGTSYASDAFGIEDSYLWVLLPNFVDKPMAATRQAILVIVVWAHGCIGMHYWLQLKDWYRSVLPACVALALLTPTLALLGFWVAIRDLGRLAQDPVWLQEAMGSLGSISQAEIQQILLLETWILYGIFALVALALAGRLLRSWISNRRGRVTLAYPDGKQVQLEPGTTILEASRGAGIPHASVCGGRGRCSTCRVRIGRGLERLPPADDAELRVLARVGAPPNVRLACQTRPSISLEVAPLLPAAAGPGEASPHAVIMHMLS